MNPKKEGYVIIFSVDGLRSVQTDSRGEAYSLEVGKTYRFHFCNGYPCRVEDIFISEKTKTIFVALTEMDNAE